MGIAAVEVDGCRLACQRLFIKWGVSFFLSVCLSACPVMVIVEYSADICSGN